MSAAEVTGFRGAGAYRRDPGHGAASTFIPRSRAASSAARRMGLHGPAERRPGRGRCASPSTCRRCNSSTATSQLVLPGAAGNRPAPSRLELEVEGVLIGDFNRAVAILRQLKNLGVRIAMDDFGTGYSSLSRYGRSRSTDQDRPFLHLQSYAQPTGRRHRARGDSRRGLGCRWWRKARPPNSSRSSAEADRTQQIRAWLVAEADRGLYCQKRGRARTGGCRRSRPRNSENGEWCCRTGLNCGPPPYQGGALPLSYGSERRGPVAGGANAAETAITAPIGARQRLLLG